MQNVIDPLLHNDGFIDVILNLFATLKNARVQEDAIKVLEIQVIFVGVRIHWTRVYILKLILKGFNQYLT